MEYLLKPDLLGTMPEIIISEKEYLDAKRCHKQNYEAFEIELAFDFVVTNYIEIEKYIAEHLVLDMVGQTRSEDAMRAQHWGFTRTLNNWLASISFWRDLTRSRLVSICGRGTELDDLEATHEELLENEFAYAFIFYLRNYSQHGGFPVTGATIGGSWDEGGTQLKFSARYNLKYDQIRRYFEQGGAGVKARRKFGKRIEEHSQGKAFDLKPIIRKSLGVLGLSMNRVRASMAGHTEQNENCILELIDKFKAAYPDRSVIGLSAMPVDDRKGVLDRTHKIPVRDEFILSPDSPDELNV
jgi:hypothetical protein